MEQEIIHEMNAVEKLIEGLNSQLLEAHRRKQILGCRLKSIQISKSGDPMPQAMMQDWASSMFLSDAVLKVCEDGEEQTISSLTCAIYTVESSSTRAVVNSAVHRLVKRGKLLRMKKGVYKING